MFKKITFFLLIVNIFSCSYFKKEEQIDNRKPIAKVNNKFLYKEDVEKSLPKKYKKKDSVLLVSNIINSWAKRQLLLSKARLNLKDNNQEIEKLVQNYREDLIINKYREAVISQNLDTLVSEQDIDSFYTKNKEILKLNEDLLKFKYVQIDKNIINRKKIEELFNSDKQEDISQLIDKELEFKSYYFNDSAWVKYSDFIKKIPLFNKSDLKETKHTSTRSQSRKKAKNYLVKEDSLDIYLISINKILRRNSISPKSYVIPTIKQMILHTRKLKLLKEIEKTLLNDANKNGQYEIYK